MKLPNKTVVNEISGNLLIFLVISFLSSAVVKASEEYEVKVLDQDFSVTRYAAKGKHLIIWIAPGFGENTRSSQTAEAFAKLGIEVWQVDLAESLFMEKNTNTLRKMTGKYVASLIDISHEKTNKQITLLTRSYGAIPVLRGARLWQIKHKESNATHLSGAILFSPELYSYIPTLGLAPVFVPISYATNIPIMVYQGGARGNRGQLDKVVENLQSGGAQVFVKTLKGVTGIFYEKDEAPETLAALKQLPNEIEGVLSLLQNITTPLNVTKLPESKQGDAHLDIGLKVFRGNPKPLPLDLRSVKGQRIIRDVYKGKVTLVNFWASWCRPCVEEIPSLNHLREIMKDKPFELISINYAEDKQTILKFLKQVNVDFPVLLDVEGSVANKWNVLVYPSTFVIDVNGKIRYGVNAAIHWDDPEVIKVINKLLEED